MKNNLKKLYDLHDKIKESPIRLAGLDEIEVIEGSQELYYLLLDNLVDEIIKYMDRYKEDHHVILTNKFCEEKQYHYKKMKKELELCYNEYKDDLLSFIAASDYKVFSPLHYIIEHLYFYLNNEYRSKNFSKRMK